VLVAVLPKFACPACAAAAIGILSSLGWGYLLTATYLLPVTAALLALALGALAFRASTRQGYGPFLVGIAAAAVVLVGKFELESGFLMYVGVGLLVVSSVWNAWPRRAAAVVSCVNCEPEQFNYSTKEN
jgi:hypothetical protein